MRIGQNPVKTIQLQAPQPKEVTIVVVNFIPYLSGYYEQSLEVLRLCLESIWNNTNLPFDLMVFDNASCPEVRSYLREQAEKNKIQYLILSDKNMGIPGAWNFTFQAAPGKYIAYADNDIYFHPGWLEEHLRVLETYPNVGMVTGIPLRSPLEFSTSTLEWGHKDPQVTTSQGALQDWDIFWTHAKSLGLSVTRAQRVYRQSEDFKFEYLGVETYLGAGHFQFVSPKEALKSILPLPEQKVMGDERNLDKEIDAHGFLRLCLPKMYVQHMGNLLPENLTMPQTRKQGSRTKPAISPRALFYKILDIYVLKRFFLFVHGQIFHLYFNRPQE
ncbi:MAG: glycosyltransferase [Chloroflexota bacterium]